MRAIINGAYVAPRGEDAEVQGFLEGITLSSFNNAERGNNQSVPYLLRRKMKLPSPV